MSRRSYVAPALSLAGLVAFSYAHAVQRTFVASYGNDANTGVNCTLSNPCRSFTAAQTVTDSGGEIVAIDAAGYGTIAITKSITITANPGAYAGISAASGSAVSIASSVKVLLRGLNINGTGGTTGILLTSDATLVVENCVISGFTGDGLNASTPGMGDDATVRIVKSTFRQNQQNGARFGMGVRAEVSQSYFLNNAHAGVRAETAGSPTFVSVSDSVSSGNGYGYLSSGFNTRMNVVRSTASDNPGSGLLAESSGVISAAYSNVTGNGTGLNGSSGPVYTMQNNVVRDNVVQTSGNIVTFTGS